MKKILLIQLFITSLYIVAWVLSIGLFVIVDILFDIELVWLPFLTFLLIPIIASAIRVSIWKRKDLLFTSEEQKLKGIKVFFLSIFVEVFLFLVAIILVLSEMFAIL